MFSNSPAVATQENLMEDSERTPLLWDPESLSYRNAASAYTRNPIGPFTLQRASTFQQMQPMENFIAIPPPPPPPLPPPEFFKQKDDARQSAHAQFCALVGCPASNASPKEKFVLNKKSLYGRTVTQLASQRLAYNFSAALNNTLLLSQVILGAALTALGASESSHILITLFGATNTIIAGLVAYLKSRAQPMRARMYRDDLERIIDEIENSEIMWRGISDGAHGYEDIDLDEVTVRSEVARLTRLYDRAIRLNGLNNPDMYMAGSAIDGSSSGGNRSGRFGGGAMVPNVAVTAAAPAATQPAGASGTPTADAQPAEDASPALKSDVKDKDKASADVTKKDDDKKPAAATDGTSDDKGKAPAQSSPPKPDETKPATQTNATPAPAPAAAPTPAPAPPPASNPAPSVASAPVIPMNSMINDPDVSPATAANIKKKPKLESNPSQGNIKN